MSDFSVTEFTKLNHTSVGLFPHGRRPASVYRKGVIPNDG